MDISTPLADKPSVARANTSYCIEIDVSTPTNLKVRPSQALNMQISKIVHELVPFFVNSLYDSSKKATACKHNARWPTLSIACD